MALVGRESLLVSLVIWLECSVGRYCSAIVHAPWILTFLRLLRYSVLYSVRVRRPAFGEIKIHPWQRYCSA